MRVTLCLLVTLFSRIWTSQSEDLDQSNCTRLEVKHDLFTKGNGEYIIDKSLHSLYKYNSFVSFPVFRHVYKNRIIFYIGQPNHWVVGKQQYLFSGQFWYQNQNPKLVNPWITGFGTNNL